MADGIPVDATELAKITEQLKEIVTGKSDREGSSPQAKLEEELKASVARIRLLEQEVEALKKAPPPPPEKVGDHAFLDGRRHAIVWRERAQDLVEAFRKGFVAADDICVVLVPAGK